MISARAGESRALLPFWFTDRGLVAAVLLTLLIVIVRTAWMCDDAFISLRTIASFVDGNGLRWNPDERVQAFTHPLWVLLISAPYAITREPYFTVLAVSILLSMAAAGVLARIARPGWNAGAALGILLFSKAFVDFSTSGLENPLSYFLVALVLLWAWRQPPDLPRACFAAGMLVVNRLDLALLVAPIVLWSSLHRNAYRLARDAAIFALPIAAWMLFSLIYYGFPFPNTAYAKLSTGIPRDELYRQGLTYFGESFSADPLTLISIGCALLIGAWQPRARPAAIGLIAYLAYVVSIGGDFMSGRFFAVPLFVAAAVLGRHAEIRRAWQGIAAGAAIVAAGLLGTAPPIVSDGTYSHGAMPPHGIADERGIYYHLTGLLRERSEWTAPPVQLGEKYRFAIERGRRAVTSDFIGLQGYLAGDRINIIDFLALADPMLARLPADRPWRVGHYSRTMPEGYFDSVRFDENRVVDPDLRAYYEQLRILTRDPVWSAPRFRSILLMNLGRFDELIERYVARTRGRRTERPAPPPITVSRR